MEGSEEVENSGPESARRIFRFQNRKGQAASC
jgi:hypothetical protein